MATDNEKLWVVEALTPRHAHYVFRTRAAARAFAKKKGWTSDQFAIYRATWGPDNES